MTARSVTWSGDFHAMVDALKGTKYESFGGDLADSDTLIVRVSDSRSFHLEIGDTLYVAEDGTISLQP